MIISLTSICSHPLLPPMKLLKRQHCSNSLRWMHDVLKMGTPCAVLIILFILWTTHCTTTSQSLWQTIKQLCHSQTEKVSHQVKEEGAGDLLDKDGGSDGSWKAAVEETMVGIHTEWQRRSDRVISMGVAPCSNSTGLTVMKVHVAKTLI